MKIGSLLFTLAVSSLAHTGLAVAADDGTAAVEALGRLNGIALACQQPALVSRARNAVVTTAPKTRGYGEAFEAATNAAYLEHGKGVACPDAATLASQMATAEKRLQASFATIK
ncbi:hypothetical protein [Dechloromonas sp. HYN0024]|jgi:hypothetical protein|uniref:hypothetical protein n=1 Tax=Dechloromonas sp. HYN0024 TaxID=2231055 RepID=UPI000E44BF51|nr:hypothetical protein [Dechloromonas sp. HYN0024]AXS78687.1 hypothetical protein HYN24_00710 [Dechloromonas sp. HYN0024]